jgi:bifunctional non-homologous end joining protein LigD
VPIDWKKIDELVPTDFTILTAPDLIRKHRDSWHEILSDKQDIGKLISQAEEIA